MRKIVPIHEALPLYIGSQTELRSITKRWPSLPSSLKKNDLPEGFTSKRRTSCTKRRLERANCYCYFVDVTENTCIWTSPCKKKKEPSSLFDNLNAIFQNHVRNKTEINSSQSLPERGTVGKHRPQRWRHNSPFRWKSRRRHFARKCSTTNRSPIAPHNAEGHRSEVTCWHRLPVTTKWLRERSVT